MLGQLCGLCSWLHHVLALQSHRLILLSPVSSSIGVKCGVRMHCDAHEGSSTLPGTEERIRKYQLTSHAKSLLFLKISEPFPLDLLPLLTNTLTPPCPC